jgi:hypothetical protein
VTLESCSHGQAVRGEMMSNKDVAGVPYPLAKSRSKALGKNVYDHVGHRKFNPNLGSIPTCFQAPPPSPPPPRIPF